MNKWIKRSLIIAFLLILLTGLAGGGFGYYLLYNPNFAPQQTAYITIDTETDFEHLCRHLEDSANCLNINSFRIVAKILKYPESVRTGRYAIEPGMNNYDLLKNLRRGQQEPVRITFNNIRFKKDLADRLSEQLMLDSQDLNALLNDETYCESLGFTLATIKAMFIPNTYEVYWNISAERLLERMKREFDAFWNEDRRNKAQAIRLSPVEVAILLLSSKRNRLFSTNTPLSQDYISTGFTVEYFCKPTQPSNSHWVIFRFSVS